MAPLTRLPHDPVPLMHGTRIQQAPNAALHGGQLLLLARLDRQHGLQAVFNIDDMDVSARVAGAGVIALARGPGGIRVRGAMVVGAVARARVVPVVVVVGVAVRGVVAAENGSQGGSAGGDEREVVLHRRPDPFLVPDPGYVVGCVEHLVEVDGAEDARHDDAVERQLVSA